ncbi:MAG: hypothetical protein M0P71_14705 [Melioribacteraceae bacterium]|jgi:hypothetical protein|nr:hypothetical protein [Melioribacteraceae bacterium]
MSQNDTITSHLIPSSKKTKEWIEKKGLEINKIATKNPSQMKQDIECWMYYHNIFNDKEFDYLTRIPNGTVGESDYYLPAKVRHIPIQKKAINVLISQQKHRPFVFGAGISDTEGKNEKTARQIHNIFDKYINETESRVSQYHIQLKSIEQQKNQLQQILSKEPQTQEEAIQQQQLQMQLPIIEEQFNSASQKIERELLFTEKDAEKINIYYKYEVKDIIEDIIQKLALKLRKSLDIERQSLKNFISHIVTGKQAYYVDMVPGKKKIFFESLNMIDVTYPTTEGIEWIQDGMWVKISKSLTKSQAIDKWKLTKEQITLLDSDFQSNTRNMGFLNSSWKNVINTGSLLYSSSESDTEQIEESHIWFRSPKEIQVKKSPNPYEEGKSFIHFLDDDEKVVNNGQLFWEQKKKVYIDKETGREYDKKDVILGTKGEQLETRYIDEIFELVILGNDLTVLAQKKPIRLYSNESYSWTCLPVIGKTFNSIIDRPYSLVWDTKDLQKLYNLINYHRELLLATSGVKGTIMDLSQLPEGMTKSEWEYKKKLGVQYIESVKKNGKVATYNQFGSFDDSVTPAIQYLDNMLQSLDYTLGNIIGVGPQRQGQVSGNDQVATYQMAIQQNSLITEIIYSEHDENERRAFEIALNLATKYMYKDGGMFDYKSDNMKTETFQVPAGVLNKIDIGIDVENNTLQEQNLKELKQFALQEYNKGSLPFRDIIKLYSTQTVKDLEKKFEFFTDEALKFAQQSQQSNIEAQNQGQERLIQLQGQMDQQIKSQEIEIKKLDLQLKEQLGNGKLKLEQEQLFLNQKVADDNAKLKEAQIISERETEGSYLMEQNRSNVMDERLKALELQIKTLIGNTSKTGMTQKNNGRSKEYIK